MSIFYPHRERFRIPRGGRRFPPPSLVRIVVWRLRMLARQAVAQAGAALGIIHQGIVTAKTRRLERELWFHGGARNDLLPPKMQDNRGSDQDAAKLVQRPLLLGDKWDF
jgi:hypothetical protein